MSLEAGRLRHRVQLQSPTETQDSDGDVTLSYTTVASVWAAVEPLSIRDFIASDQQKAGVVARITIRKRSDILPTWRVMHDSTVYGIAGILADRESGIEFQTLAVTAGVTEGE